MTLKMLRVRTLVLLVVALALPAGAAAHRSSAPTRVESARSSTVTRATSLEAVLLQQINLVRGAHGLGSLSPSVDLSRSAVAHSRAMATYGFFSHDSRNGASFAQRIKRYYVPRSNAWTVGENLAMFGGSTPTAGAIVDAWMSSPGHRANLLRGTFREAGVAIVFDSAAGGVFGGESTWVITLDLGRR